MIVEESIKSAVSSIKTNGVRSFLTALAIIIGTAAVITVIGIGSSAEKALEASIDDLGPRTLSIFPSQRKRGGVSQGEAEAPVHRHQRKAAGQGHGNQAEQTVAAGLRREILTPVLPRGVAVGLLTQTNSAWARRRGGR